MLTANQVRSDFLEFFKGKGHTFIPSSSIVPKNDPTLLFANAGMNQYKDIFVGLKAPDCPRAVNSQKCLRVSGKHNDLEEVGKDTYHHTFFEMLGNWSFADYFKAETIEWAWELLTKVWAIDPDKLWVSVFAGDEADGLGMDEEAAELWTKVTPIKPERILAFGKKDNFWEMGNTGPCGPCSEIHIDLGPDRCDMQNVPGHKCGVNAGCARFIELWNLVFIQYNRAEDCKLTPLKDKYVDTGAGLERIVSVLQNKTSNYDTDLFMPIIDYIAKISGHKYTSKLGSKTDNAFRVIADHIRTLTFAITDGAVPSNDGRGYVIRRILRRACRFGRQLGLHEPFMYKIVDVVADYMGDAFGEIRQRKDYVATVIESEEASFGRTLDRGIEIFNTAAKRAASDKTQKIPGEDAFALYDTYGFPFDLTRLMAQEQQLSVDVDKFNELMEQQRTRARQAQKQTTFAAGLSGTQLPVTDDGSKYLADNCHAKILGFIDKNGFTQQGNIPNDQQLGLILDKTCFYAESGGQVGDCGLISATDAKFIVEDTTQIADTVIHQGTLECGSLKVGDKISCLVSKDRDAIRKNHTATHLLQWSLQKVVGESVAQQGSLVCTEYLRFDFTAPKALTDAQIKEVEQLINEQITADQPVTCNVMPKEDAEKLGAMALFGEKYGSEVRVVAIGAENDKKIAQAFSREFCGGTHVNNTGFIGGFKITREESISAGIRRITALTGTALSDHLTQRSEIIDNLSRTLKVPAEQVQQRVEQLLEQNKKLSKQLKSAAKQSGGDIMSEAKKLLSNCKKINDTSIVCSKLENTTTEQARAAIDMIKKKASSAAVVFGFDDAGKVTLLVGVTDDLIKKGLKAGDIIKQIAPVIGGGGGGRPQMAQAGGKDAAKIPDAIEKAQNLIENMLST
ncbi:MAG: alanine--tRNA ligase [Phycisphaerae bacterium]|nr:alanine--tRNA ligase [Phycisphaerae bacterium]